MGTWGAGVFESDGALDFVGQLTDRWVMELTTEIEAILADDERSMLDEDGEGILVPSVEILAVLAENCHAQPPKPDVIARWRTAYLTIFDDQIDSLEPEGDYANERRAVIVATFDRLWKCSNH